MALLEKTSSVQQIRPPTYGNLITILSIDGGGIRGIIPGVILAYLEAQLQVQIHFNLRPLSTFHVRRKGFETN